MSSDLPQAPLVALARGLREARLDAIVIGNTAAMLSGAPVTTQDIDLLTRDTPLNRRKLVRLSQLIGAAPPAPVSELSNFETIVGAALPIDISYDRIAGGLTFEWVRSRAELKDIGGEKLRVASLADVIRSKEAADRPKDRAVLPILRDTLAVQRELARRR